MTAPITSDDAARVPQPKASHISAYLPMLRGRRMRRPLSADRGCTRITRFR